MDSEIVLEQINELRSYHLCKTRVWEEIIENSSSADRHSCKKAKNICAPISNIFYRWSVFDKEKIQKITNPLVIVQFPIWKVPDEFLNCKFYKKFCLGHLVGTSLIPCTIEGPLSISQVSNKIIFTQCENVKKTVVHQRI
jgi:hypothetical protein